MTFIFILTLYLFPWCVAKWRKHRNSAPIGLTNFFFGWTGIGWLIALIWAFSDNVKAKGQYTRPMRHDA